MLLFSLLAPALAGPDDPFEVNKLLGERDEDVTALAAASRKLEKLDAELAEVRRQESKMEPHAEQIRMWQSHSPDDPSRNTEIQRHQDELNSLKESIGSRDSNFLLAEIATTKALQQRLGDKLRTGASGIAELNVEQGFRKQISYIFAFLIAIVIVGFFIVVLRDEKIRLQVFNADHGIQFVTLFSLVIAIILFGIMKVLESKELSALLGGLSGYILGRTRLAAAVSTDNASPPVPKGEAREPSPQK